MPELLERDTLKAAEADPRAMADRVLEWIRLADLGLRGPGTPIRLVVVEAFSHRAWLTTLDGKPRRVREAVPMARLVERIVTAVELELRVGVVEAPPEESKPPWSSVAARKAMPAVLRNQHERDAWAAVCYGLSFRREAR